MTNKVFYNQMFDKMEKYLAKSLGEIMAMSGVSLTTLDPDQVRIWNEAIEYFDDCKELTLNWAESQDEINNKNKIMLQTMTGMISKNGDQLDRIERKLDKKN